MPPRKVKTIPLENNTLDKEDECFNEIATYDAVINLIQDEEPVDVLEDVPPIVEKVKKVRISRKKKEVEPPIEVSEDDDEPEVVEPEVVEPEVVEDKKKDENIKVVELLQCDKCGKKLTARTLKYSHNAVCPANGNKTPPKAKRVKPDDEVIEEVKTPNKVERIKKRQDKFNQLFANAV